MNHAFDDLDEGLTVLQTKARIAKIVLDGAPMSAPALDARSRIEEALKGRDDRDFLSSNETKILREFIEHTTSS